MKLLKVNELLRWLAAARNLVASVELDGSTDGGESFTVFGNVNADTLRTLGFKLPESEDK